MDRLKIVGEKGFVGQHLVEAIRDTPTEFLPQANTIFYLAARVNVAESIQEPRYTFENNTGIASNLIESARQLGWQIIYLTSVEVFGPGRHRGISNPINPTNPYAASKAATDALIMMARNQYGVKTSIVRTQNVFGQHQSEDKFIPTVIKKLYEGEPVQLFGEARRRWVHADHLAEKLLDIAETPRDANVTGGELISNRMLVQQIADIMGVTPRIEVQNQVRNGHEEIYSLEPTEEPSKNFIGDLGSVVDHFLKIFMYRKMAGALG